jgi:hypothetical protein
MWITFPVTTRYTSCKHITVHLNYHNTAKTCECYFYKISTLHTTTVQRRRHITIRRTIPHLYYSALSLFESILEETSPWPAATLHKLWPETIVNLFYSGKRPTWRTVLFSCMFISIPYVFRATPCSSSGESIVSIQLLVYVTLCRWPSGMQVGKELPDLHTRRSPTQSDIYQTLYWYNWFSWWWARGCWKHVEDWNKHIWKKNCASSWSITRIIPSCTVNRTYFLFNFNLL